MLEGKSSVSISTHMVHEWTNVVDLRFDSVRQNTDFASPKAPDAMELLKTGSTSI